MNILLNLGEHRHRFMKIQWNIYKYQVLMTNWNLFGKLSKACGKNGPLCTHPSKLSRQFISRMNIISMGYLQQGLDCLLQTQYKEVSLDKVVQSVWDLFDNSVNVWTFSHMVHSKAAILDVGFNRFKDINAKVMFLPLTGPGYGVEFRQKSDRKYIRNN